MRIIFITVSFIPALALACGVADAREPRGPVEPLYVESVYPVWPVRPVWPARDGNVIFVQEEGFEDLSSEEQQRIIENYRKYKKLPPDKREKMKSRYKKWKKMPPDEKKKLKKNYYKKYKK